MWSKEAHASIVLDVISLNLSEPIFSCKIVKNSRIIGLNRARKNKFCSRHSTVFLRPVYKNTDKKYIFERLVNTVNRFVAKI